MTRQPSAPSHAPDATFAPSWPETADHHLGAVISLDVPRDTVHVDIRGSLTSGTRSHLLGIAGRIRALRAGSHIHVQLGRAAFVRSAALAGLRSDLEAMAGNSGGTLGHGRGVSLETRRRESARTFRHTPPGIIARPARRVDPTKADLLTASDFVFGWLDDELGCPGTNVSAMVALYELIGRDIACRTGSPAVLG